MVRQSFCCAGKMSCIGGDRNQLPPEPIGPLPRPSILPVRQTFSFVLFFFSLFLLFSFFFFLFPFFPSFLFLSRLFPFPPLPTQANNLLDVWYQTLQLEQPVLKGGGYSATWLFRCLNRALLLLGHPSAVRPDRQLIVISISSPPQKKNKKKERKKERKNERPAPTPNISNSAAASTQCWDILELTPPPPRKRVLLSLPDNAHLNKAGYGRSVSPKYHGIQ